MLHSQNNKFVVLKAAGTIATNATNTAYFDARGWHYATIRCVMPVATATNSSAKWGVLKLRESDDTTTTVTAISGFIGTTNSTAVSTGTAQEFVIPAQNDTSNPQEVIFGLDLRSRKRYISVESQGGASHNTICILAQLSRGVESANTLAERGANVGAAVFG